MNVPVCMYVCICKEGCMYVCMHACTYDAADQHGFGEWRVTPHLCMYVYNMHVCMPYAGKYHKEYCVYIYIYIYIYIYTYTILGKFGKHDT